MLAGWGLIPVESHAATSPQHGEEFRDWLDTGAAGEMGYLSRGKEKRCDPQQVLPGVQSIIVLGMNYWQGDLQEPAGTERTGAIARYAWGKDYHDVIHPNWMS